MSVRIFGDIVTSDGLKAGSILVIGDDGDIGAIEPGRSRSIDCDYAGCLIVPGFIDVHTHDDTAVIRTPAMLPKISQGVTTVIVGNCGISAAPVTLRGEPPDPMNLLGGAKDFR